LKPADFGRLLASSDVRGVIPNRELQLAPFAEFFSSATTAGASSIEARRGMVRHIAPYGPG